MIHPTAVIDPAATIGDHVTVGPFAVIEAGVTLGDGCQVGAHAVLSGRTTVGRDNRFFAHSVIGGIPQDLKYKGEDTALNIGDGNTFREFVTVNTGTEGGGGVTRIGDNNLLMAYVHVAHDCQLHDRTVLANAATLAGHVSLGSGATIGGLTAIHQFTRVGELAMVGGCSAVDQDVPPYCLAMGNRVSLRGLNLTGLKRSGLSREQLRSLRTAYGELFQSEETLSDALTGVASRYAEHEQVMALVAFVQSSERGVCR